MRYLLLCPLAVLYGLCVPRTVQSLDTGDIVTAGLRLWVAHPPGYPLIAWLLHAFFAVVPWGSPFARASVVSAICMLGGLAFMVALCETWLSALLVVVIGTLPVVWRYAVLPDVFALHVLLTCAVLYFALTPIVRYRELWVCIAFGLAAANHQTIVFLAPLVMLVLLERRSWRHAVIAIAAGAGITIASYMSLLLFDTASIQSWGDLQTIPDVIRHFLRSDYGTFHLSGHTTEHSWLGVTTAFIVAAWPLLVAAGAGALLLRRPLREVPRAPFVLCAAICLLAYIGVFFALMNLPHSRSYLAMVERFFVFPVIVLTAIAVRIMGPLTLPRAATLAAAGLAAILATQNVAQAASLFTLPHDFVIEDYARNLLDTAAATARPSFLLVDGDTKLFAVRYVQALGGERDIIPLSTGRVFDRAILEKLEVLRPSFHIDEKVVFEKNERSLFARFVMPNVDAYDFTHTLGATMPSLRTIFYPLGRKVVRGEGVGFAEAATPLRLHLPVTQPTGDERDEQHALFTEYSIYYLALGRDAFEHQRIEDAIRFFREGLGVVPWCVPCIENACRLERTIGANDPSCSEAGIGG